jgi:hypothetical protein
MRETHGTSGLKEAQWEQLESNLYENQTMGKEGKVRTITDIKSTAIRK